MVKVTYLPSRKGPFLVLKPSPASQVIQKLIDLGLGGHAVNSLKEIQSILWMTHGLDNFYIYIILKKKLSKM